jgi:hypothetical protein
MDRQKLIHQLFIGKVADVLGLEKTTELLKEAKEAFAIHDVVGSTVTETKTRLLFSAEFHCSNCNTIHTRSSYAIAQRAMNVDLIFTCDCGNKINV